VEAVAGVRPRVDLLIEFGDEAAGEHLGTLPTDPRRDPGLAGAVQIVGGEALAQGAGAGERLADVIDEIVPIALGGGLERRRTSLRGSPEIRPFPRRRP
jgi:hypothetical protein